MASEQALAGAEQLVNGNFDAPGTGPTKLDKSGVAGVSAAPSWTTWNNGPGVTTTDLLPSPQGGQMLHVCTTGAGNEIVQSHKPSSSDPRKVRSTVSIFVLRGQVGIGAGNGGATGPDDAKTDDSYIGRWKPLHGMSHRSPVNEFIITAISPGGACFYVDSASVQAI